MNIMPIDNIPDWEMRIKRHDAFWEREIIDRPLVHMSYTKADIETIQPSACCNWKDCWYDVTYQVESKLTEIENTIYMGDKLPIAFPNIGPDIFPACYGGEIEFEETTSYIKHFLQNWDEFETLNFSLDKDYPQKIEELYKAFFEVARGKFYLGQPDLHPGADCMVGLRGPAELCMDLFDNPDGVKSVLKTITDDFLNTFDYYMDKITAKKHAITGWPSIVSTKRWHVPSNDFSYMIGPDQFNEFFLDGLTRECNHAEASIYHLDGTGALCHLDSLLSIKNLNAIQWVYGAGNGRASDWIEVYQKIQAKDKGIQLLAELDELDILMENLKPEGVHLIISGIETQETGEFVIKKISSWR